MMNKHLNPMIFAALALLLAPAAHADWTGCWKASPNDFRVSFPEFRISLAANHEFVAHLKTSPQPLTLPQNGSIVSWVGNCVAHFTLQNKQGLYILGLSAEMTQKECESGRFEQNRARVEFTVHYNQPVNGRTVYQGKGEATRTDCPPI